MDGKTINGSRRNFLKIGLAAGLTGVALLSFVRDAEALNRLYTTGVVELAETTTPSSPLTGFDKLYFKSNHYPYILDHDGNEKGLLSTLVESGGTALTMGAVSDAQYLKRSGTSIISGTIAAGDLPSAIDAVKIGAGGVSNTEFGYLDGVSSALQTQLDAKMPINLANPADHSYSGVTITATAGEPVAIGDVCCFKSDAKFWMADSDAEATTKGLIAMATATISAEASGVFLWLGKYRDDSWTWATVGAELYISGTPGNPTITRPTGAGKLVRIIGHAYSSTIVVFKPSQTYIELSA